jgi:hypothetical protein
MPHNDTIHNFFNKEIRMPWNDLPNTNVDRTRFVSMMHQMDPHYGEFDVPSLDRMLDSDGYKAFHWNRGSGTHELVMLIRPRGTNIPEISMLGWVSTGSTAAEACQAVIDHVIAWASANFKAVRCYFPSKMGDGTGPINQLHKAIIAEAEAGRNIKMIKDIPTDEGRVLYIAKV